MTPFTVLHGRAVALPQSNIDTDQLVPARFMSRTRAEGYGPVLLHDQRHGEDGTPFSDHPLNAQKGTPVTVLVTGRNLGTGSSREAAVYALADFGIRCVIAASFGDIFAANAVKNGLLPARVAPDDSQTLLDRFGDDQGGAITVDLEFCRIAAGDWFCPFEIEPAWREQLLNGWDDIDLTLQHADAIARWVDADGQRRSWVRPAWKDGSAS